MSRHRILIIEPNLELSEVLQEYLVKSGFEVSPLPDAQSGACNHRSLRKLKFTIGER